MPIYELYCERCQHEFEQIVPFSATTLPPCPVCENENVGRRMSRPAIHFKGSGWYITDSRKGKGKHADSDNGNVTTKADKAEDKSNPSSVSNGEGGSSSGDGGSNGDGGGSKKTETTPVSSTGSAAKSSGE